MKKDCTDLKKNEKTYPKIYDILIVGGGVAGMSAAIYAKRRGKDVAILESFVLGGQVNTIPMVENFPSQSSIDGLSLSQKFSAQVQSLGVEVIFDQISSTKLAGAVKTLVGRKGTYQCKSVIVASGLSYVPLGLNENDFLGRGVSFCAVCDANFFKGKPVCVASRGGSGLLAAKQLAEVCSQVVVLDSADMSVFASANKNKKIEVVSNAQILEILGKDAVCGVKVLLKTPFVKNSFVKNPLAKNSLAKNSLLKNFNERKSDGFDDRVDKVNETDGIDEIDETEGVDRVDVAGEVDDVEKIFETSALFVELGKRAQTEIFEGVKCDQSGFIITDENMKTNLDGVYAAGDVRSKALKQIVTAASDGAIAGQNA